MPATSKKQDRFMRAVAHSPDFAKKVGVPQSVGREFSKSGGGSVDQSFTGANMKKRAFRGEETPKEEREEAKAVRKGAVSPREYAKKEKAEGEKVPTKALVAKGQKLKSGELSADSYAMGMKRGGTTKKMASGGKVKKMAEGGVSRSPDVRPPGGMMVRPQRGTSEGEALGANLAMARRGMSEGDALRAGMGAGTNMPRRGAAPVAPPTMPLPAPGQRASAMKKGGSIDGAAKRGKTKGRIR